MRARTRIRIEDVARAAGVSTATVSRALSQPDLVRPDTRALVQQTVARLGYVPDAAGRALASGQTHTVGCVIPTLDYAIFARSTNALQMALAAAGYQLLVASHNYDLDQEHALVLALQQRGVDALVLVGAERSRAAWATLRDWGHPVLLTWSADPRLPSVGFDNHGIGALATRHLLDLGHRRIAMVSGYTAHNDRARARAAGVRETLEAAGLSLPAHCVSEQELSIQGGRQGLDALLAAGAAPTAVVCGTDLLAAGVLLRAQALGLRVPDDLSICGVDNHELAAELLPGLTTVSLPTHDLGRVAAAQVLAALAGEPVARQSLLPFELLVRGTSGPPSS